MTDEKRSLKVVPLPTGGHTPPPQELIDTLEDTLKRAKEGSLRECILSIAYDAGEDAPVYEDGTRLLVGGHLFWREDGRLDAIHSHLGVLTYQALKELVDDDEG